MVRKILRNMAKAKMQMAGVEKPNRKMRGGAWRYWLRWEPNRKMRGGAWRYWLRWEPMKSKV